MEYLSNVDEGTWLMWTHDQDDTMIVDVLCSKETLIRLSHVVQENISTFILSYFECMVNIVKDLKGRVLNDKKRCQSTKNIFSP